MASQDRFDRVKHSHHFPKGAIDWCLKYAGITEEDVDYVTMGMDPKSYFRATFSYMNKAFNLHNIFNRTINTVLFLTCIKSIDLLNKQFNKK